MLTWKNPLFRLGIETNSNAVRVSSNNPQDSERPLLLKMRPTVSSLLEEDKEKIKKKGNTVCRLTI